MATFECSCGWSGHPGFEMDAQMKLHPVCGSCCKMDMSRTAADFTEGQASDGTRKPIAAALPAGARPVTNGVGRVVGYATTPIGYQAPTGSVVDLIKARVTELEAIVAAADDARMELKQLRRMLGASSRRHASLNQDIQ